ncbi:MAG: hypothetical protein V3V74_07480 [Nitrosomonadaceae bacterium]
MKKITMIVVLLMMTTMNLMATPTNLVADTQDIPANIQVGQEVCTLSATLNEPGAVSLHYSKTSQTGINNYVSVDENTGVVTWTGTPAGGTPFVFNVGDIHDSKFRCSEKDINGAVIQPPGGGNGNTFMANKDFTITPAASNGTLPEMTSIAAYSPDDGAKNDEVIGYLTAEETDPFPEAIVSFSIVPGGDSSAVKIDNTNELQVADEVQYILGASLVFDVIATDSGGDDSLPYTITLTVVAGPLELDTMSLNVSELAENTDSVGFIESSGGDGTRTVTQTGTASTVFAVATNGEVTVIDDAVLDYENGEPQTFTLNIEVTDSAAPTPTVVPGSVLITVTDKNEVFLAPNQERFVNVNTVTPFDIGNPLNRSTEDGATDSWAITAPAVHPFDIDDNGQISVIAPMLVQTYTLTISLTGDHTVSETVDVTVNPPVDYMATGIELTFQESTAASTFPMLTTIKVPTNALMTSYSIETNPYFGINNSGFITIKQELDYEAFPTGYKFDITATKGVDSEIEEVTFLINDLDDDGTVTFTAVSYDRTVPEDATASYVILGTFINDVTRTPSYTHNLVFTISSNTEVLANGTTGELTVQPTADFDFETPTSYSYILTATDPLSGATDTATVNLIVTDVIEDGSPVLPLNQTVELEIETYGDNEATGVFITNTGDNLEFTNTGTNFSINSLTGEIVVLNSVPLVEGFTEVFGVTSRNTVTNEQAAGTVTIKMVVMPVVFSGEKKKDESAAEKLSKATQCLVANGYGTLTWVMLGFMALLILAKTNALKEQN